MQIITLILAEFLFSRFYFIVLGRFLFGAFTHSCLFVAFYLLPVGCKRDMGMRHKLRGTIFTKQDILAHYSIVLRRQQLNTMCSISTIRCVEIKFKQTDHCCLNSRYRNTVQQFSFGVTLL